MLTGDKAILRVADATERRESIRRSWLWRLCVNRHISEQWPEPIEPGWVRVNYSKATRSDNSRFNPDRWHSNCRDDLSTMASRQEAGCSRPKVSLEDILSILPTDQITENFNCS